MAFAAFWFGAIIFASRLLGVLEREPELRAAYAADTRQARIALAGMFGSATTDEEQAVRVARDLS